MRVLGPGVRPRTPAASTHVAHGSKDTSGTETAVQATCGSHSAVVHDISAVTPWCPFLPVHACTRTHVHIHTHTPARPALISKADSIDKLLIAAALAGPVPEVPSNGIWRF